MIVLRALLLVGVFLQAHVSHATEKSASGDSIVHYGAYRIFIQNPIESNFEMSDLLGAHALWWGVQDGLMEAKGSRFLPRVEEFFKKNGALIRYGGGANEVSYKSCAGVQSEREPVRAVRWAGPMLCRFGIPEYVSSVRAAGADKAWLISNIAGIDYRRFDLKELSAEVSGGVATVKALAADMRRYWELGNELERGSYKWSPEVIAERASLAASLIREIDPEAQVVLPLIEYDAVGQPSRREFNRRLLRSMKNSVDGVALHLYYDGRPGGPTISTQLRTIREVADLYRNIKDQPPRVWITEHGRWPNGDSSDPNWRSNWYQTNDMGGVIGTADFLIGISQIFDVAGAMLHGVRAGPWNIFDITSQGPDLSGVGRLYSLLSANQPSRRLVVSTSSVNRGGYSGGYDLRATAFASADLKKITLWVVNRSSEAVDVPIDGDLIRGKVRSINGQVMTCKYGNGRCAGSQFDVDSINSNMIIYQGYEIRIVLEPRSVTSLVVDVL